MKYIFLLLTALALLFTPCARAATLTIPGSVTVIEEEAFCGVEAAEALVVSEGVVRIEARAFAESGIKRVTLPDSLLALAEDWLDGVSLLSFDAPEGSFAWDWGIDHGYIEKTPFVVSPGKDFASVAAAKAIVETACLTEWSGAGKIRYVEQFGGARTYVPQYWVSASDARGSCTRAAGSMAASYMGINALPRAAANFTKFQNYMKTQGCIVQTDNGCSLSTFVDWYDAYARDTVGAVSPVVIYTQYGASQHAFVVIGRDKNAHDCFYIADSGSSSYVNRVKLAAENGRLYVDQYIFADGRVDERYGKDHPMIYMWRYVKK